MEGNGGSEPSQGHLPVIRYREGPRGARWRYNLARRTRTPRDCRRTYSYPNNVVLAVIDDWRRLFEENRAVQEDNRELRATVDVQTARIHELETDVLEEQKKAEALR